jgi:hypothetical protein
MGQASLATTGRYRVVDCLSSSVSPGLKGQLNNDKEKAMVIRTHHQLYQLQLSRTRTVPVSGFSGCRKTYRAAKAGMLLKNMRRASVVIRITCSCICTSSGRRPARTLVYWLEVMSFSLYAGRADNRRDPPAYLATPFWSRSTIFGQIFWLWGASICQPACFFSPPSHFFIFRLHSFLQTLRAILLDAARFISSRTGRCHGPDGMQISVSSWSSD